MLRTTEDRPLAAATRGLRIRDLWKRFGRTDVLKGIDLDVDKGELITVLGPSGSGKTTLLRLLCGFERADGGRIELGNRLVSDGGARHLPPEKRGIGYVAQEGALFPHLSVQENLLFGLPRQFRKTRRQEKARRAATLLELVGLPSAYAARKPAALSGGEQQRVALARALAPNPAIVLLDEPFSALDAGLRAGLRDTIATSLKRVNTTALLVTHDQDEALSTGDRVAVLQNGRLAQVASPQALYRFPANRDIARFVGDAVLLPGTAHNGMVECIFGRLPLAPETREDANALEGDVDVMIRPEQFQLTEPTAHPCNATGRARVEQLIFYGHDARLTLRMGNGQQLMASVPGVGLPGTGEEVGFRIVGNVVAYPRRQPHDKSRSPHVQQAGAVGTTSVAISKRFNRD
jgi:iron(III) transport system ATP-binding protein